MSFKYCIAKMVDTAPVYQTDTVNTWVSDITDKSVEWYASEGAARNALRGPETYVVPYDEFTIAMRCEALTRACKALSEAIRVGAVDAQGAGSWLYVGPDVYDALKIYTEKVNRGDVCDFRFGTFHGISVCSCTIREETK